MLRLTLALPLLILGLIGPLIPTGTGASQKPPAIYEDSIQVTTWALTHYRGNDNLWSWVPKIKFHIAGPVPAGSVLSVDFTLPGGGSLVQFDCGTHEVKEGHFRQIECGGRSLEESKGSIYTGMVNFAIKMRNELMGTSATLFTGRAKVAKAPAPPNNPKEIIYYVDHDWNLPIGYIFYHPHDIYGWEEPYFNIAFWVRVNPYPIEPHLMYKGQPVAKGDCNPEVENETVHYANTLPKGASWKRVGCRFIYVQGWKKAEGRGYSMPPHIFAENPGEYEVKVLLHNRLARSIKFTVDADGNLENGIREANKLRLHNNRVIVPVQIIGDLDGPWDRSAWKTDAFYGHPLAGFTPPQ